MASLQKKKHGNVYTPYTLEALVGNTFSTAHCFSFVRHGTLVPGWRVAEVCPLCGRPFAMLRLHAEEWASRDQRWDQAVRWGLTNACGKCVQYPALSTQTDWPVMTDVQDSQGDLRRVLGLSLESPYLNPLLSELAVQDLAELLAQALTAFPPFTGNP